MISCFEGSLTSFSKIILTSYFSSFGSDFHAKIFSNLFLKTLPLMGGWMGDHVQVCFILKNHLKLKHEWVVGI